jgi:competence protein ComEC
VLIDGGVDSRVLTELSNALGFFDKDIDMIIATHPDADHIGGLIDVLMRYDVDTIVMTENENDTPIADAFQKMVEEEGVKVIYARSGQVFDLGSGEAGSTTLSILFPDHDPTNLESNMSSIVARLSYGESSYLLTGDSPIEIEEYLVRQVGSALTSNVLKVGHHGSRTSTSENFITAVSPIYGIISAG